MVHGLLIAGAALVEPTLQGTWASVVKVSGLCSTGSVMVLGLSCSTARGIFLDQGSNPCLLQLLDWKADSFTIEPPGEPSPVIFYKIKFDQLAGK